MATREIKMVAAMVRRNFTVAREETGMPTREVFLFTKMPENLKVSFKKDNPTLIVNEGIEPLSPV
ncbi:hypothetical protein [Methylomicrobium sp. Wu6]|uniref:hypothetical protein n=1 Tax=Methylomicrobium sp. Wu6 TaxID=3107928 RepID=UPI002DD68F98|nr:hypothetical protein [Methylomicrobium sp. Wu6]MEC4748749.1 hypothetical protein [Methylomicrobium sp. Wu6]